MLIQPNIETCGNIWDTHSDTEFHVFGSIIHSHPSREGFSCIPTVPDIFKHTEHKLDSLTQAFPELPCIWSGLWS